MVVLGILLAVVLGAAGTEDAMYRLRPGARGKACLSCHAEFSETLAQPSVHTPVRAGSCADCHDPHASPHGKLLAAEPGAICLTCHRDIIPEGARSTHQVALAGGCVSCHDPHASPNRAMLRQSGNELCLGCHGKLAEAITAARFKHSPVQKNCLSCHDPHASPRSEHLLVKDESALCAGCHKPEQPMFARAHGNYSVARARCTSCHDPHGSNSRGSLWATVHAPVASGMCGQCHHEPGSPEPLGTRRDGLEACRPCHGELVGRTFTTRRTHWPVVDGSGCLHCHGPHATREPSLLRAAMPDLCYGCHADTKRRQELTATKHPPAESGECLVCHDPHASDATFLFSRADLSGTCLACHDWQQHSSHPIGDEVTDPRNPNLSVDCSSCHRSHGAAHPHLAPFDTDAELCVQCHAAFRR